MPQFKISRTGYADCYVTADELDIVNGHLMISGTAAREGRPGSDKQVVAAFANTEWVSVISTAVELYAPHEVDERVAAILGNVRDRVVGWRDAAGLNQAGRNVYDNVIAELDERLRRLDVGEPVF